MTTEPSKKQLGYLKGLGYDLSPPLTTGEASHLINEMKGGTTARKAEKSLTKFRKSVIQEEKDKVKNHNRYMRSLEEMNRELRGAGVGRDLACAGFRFKGNKSEVPEEYHQYIKAFIPFDIAKKLPDLMMLPYFETEELVREPKHGKFITKKGGVIEVEKAPSRGKKQKVHKTGCLSLIVVGTILLYAII